MTRRDQEVVVAVREFLEEGPARLPDSVFTAVMDAVPATRQRRGLLASFSTMPLQVAAGTALAAVVAGIAIWLSMNVAWDANVGDPDASPSDAGADLRLWLAAGDIPPGTYVVEEPLPIRITLTLPEGTELFTVMHREVGICLGPCGDDYIGVDVWVPEVTSVDPCRVAAGLVDPISGDADDLVAHITGQELLSLRGPEPSIVGGHPATYLEMEATAGVADCDGGILRLLGARTELGQLVHLQRAPGAAYQTWIVDVGGTPVVVDVTTRAETTDAQVELLRGIVESMRIEPDGT